MHQRWGVIYLQFWISTHQHLKGSSKIEWLVQILIAVVLGIMWSHNLPSIKPRYNFVDLFCGEAQATKTAQLDYRLGNGNECISIFLPLDIYFFFSHMPLGLPVDTLWLPLTSFYVTASASWILLLHLESCSLGHGVCVCVRMQSYCRLGYLLSLNLFDPKVSALYMSMLGSRESGASGVGLRFMGTTG